MADLKILKLRGAIDGLGDDAHLMDGFRTDHQADDLVWGGLSCDSLTDLFPTPHNRNPIRYGKDILHIMADNDYRDTNVSTLRCSETPRAAVGSSMIINLAFQ
jgi:hypothetical protein